MRSYLFVCVCVCVSERVGFGEWGWVVRWRGGKVRKAFILDQIGNSELFHCGIERLVFLFLQERY